MPDQPMTETKVLDSVTESVLAKHAVICEAHKKALEAARTGTYEDWHEDDELIVYVAVQNALFEIVETLTEDEDRILWLTALELNAESITPKKVEKTRRRWINAINRRPSRHA